MVKITVEIDEADVNLFARVFTAGHLKLLTNGVSMSVDAHRRVMLSRIFKNGLEREAEQLLPPARSDPVATARRIAALRGEIDKQCDTLYSRGASPA